MRAVLLVLVAVTWTTGLSGQTPAGNREGRGDTGSSPALARVSARQPPWGQLRTAVGSILGWDVGVPLASFREETVFQAADKAAVLGVSIIEGSSGQKVSTQIPKNLDHGLAPGEVRAVQKHMAARRLRMPVYSTATLGEDERIRRRVFEFAKSLEVETLVVEHSPGVLPLIDALADEADEYDINVALSGSPEAVGAALQRSGRRIGAYADIGQWMESGIEPLDGIRLLKDRLLVVRLTDRTAPGNGGHGVTSGNGSAGIAQLLEELERSESTPSLIVGETRSGPDVMADLSRSLDGFERAVRPIAARRVAELSREIPIKGPDHLTPEQREQIIAAVPQRSAAKPERPRRILVFDANIGYGGKSGGHRSIPAANLAIDLFGKATGAYEAVFSNDLENFKYDRLRQFDAVFLNNTVGMIFVDPEVRVALTRFVSEGGGLAGYHGTTHASMDWPEFGEMLGAAGGSHRAPTEIATIKLDDPTSPLTATFEDEEFVHQDEFYRFTEDGPFSRDSVRVLMSIDVEKTDMNQGRDCRNCVRADNDYALSWIRSYGSGRVFYTALGHAPAFFTVPELNEFFFAGIQFVLGDLEADTTPSARANLTR